MARILTPIVGTLLVCAAGCATRPRPASRSPIPLEVLVRAECHGQRMGLVHAELDLESALARRLWQSTVSEFSGVALLKVELACTNGGVRPASVRSVDVDGKYRIAANHDLPPESTSAGLWLCVARDEDCVPQKQSVSDHQLSGPDAVADFVLIWLKDELSADATLIAPGSQMR